MSVGNMDVFVLETWMSLFPWAAMTHLNVVVIYPPNGHVDDVTLEIDDGLSLLILIWLNLQNNDNCAELCWRTTVVEERGWTVNQCRDLHQAPSRLFSCHNEIFGGTWYIRLAAPSCEAHTVYSIKQPCETVEAVNWKNSTSTIETLLQLNLGLCNRCRCNDIWTVSTVIL